MAAPSGDTPDSSCRLLSGFMTPEELAAQLGISQRTLSRWHAQRIGPARCTVGKLILYRVDAVRAWLADQERSFVSKERQRR